MKKQACIAILLLAAGAAAAAGKPHQHGVASLSAAVDGNILELEFESPLEDLVGFEHAPRNDAQRRALQAMKERFAAPQALFMPSPKAGCRAAPAELEMPQGGEHADLHALVRFQCATPEALRGLELRLFDAFPRLQRVRVQLAAPGRQAGAEVTRQKRRLDW